MSNHFSVIRRSIMKHNESNEPNYRRSTLRIITVVTYMLAMLCIGVTRAAQAAGKRTNGGQTSVLVHGAWADASSWNEVTTRLQADGYTVWAVPNPLRGLSSDPAYVASSLDTITGPIILV